MLNSSSALRFTHEWLRTRMDVLVLHHLMGRSEMVRMAEFSSSAMTAFSNEGRKGQDCPCLVIARRKGKTISDGQVHYSGTFRNKNVALCAISSIALYLFYRWDLDYEIVPDFNTRDSWYNTKLFMGNRAQSEANRSTQNYWVKKLFEEAGVVSTKVTHTFRGSSARIAESIGIGEHEVGP